MSIKKMIVHATYAIERRRGDDDDDDIDHNSGENAIVSSPHFTVTVHSTKSLFCCRLGKGDLALENWSCQSICAQCCKRSSPWLFAKTSSTHIHRNRHSHRRSSEQYATSRTRGHGVLPRMIETRGRRGDSGLLQWTPDHWRLERPESSSILV